MNTHIDQLAQWWENAETGTPNPRDLLIVNLGADEYMIAHAGDYLGEGEEYEATRILARAPKPEPAWHDAVAVIAHTARFSERRPFALTHTEDVLDPYNTEWITRDDLIDPAPLIEAKVTDEMRARAIAAYEDDHGSFAARIDATLTAALGIEAE